MKPCKRVAIVGGGFSGVMSIKSLKEDGIEPVCFEKSPAIGGTWCYRAEAKEGLPSTMWTTIINHSKEMGACSNYPPAAEFPNYMSHQELYRYFLDFSKRFDLLRHVLCNREVTDVRRAEDYDDTGSWNLVIKNLENGEITTEVFDGVFVCVGHITYPKIPQLPEMQKFKGQILHSHSLKKVEPFRGQRVAVVGTGCSALDAAVEISSVADKVYLSVRTPSWIMPRVGPYGLPMDYAMLRRYSAWIQNTLPLKWASKYIEYNFLDPKFSHKLYGIEPKYPFLARDPIVNDSLPAKLLSGSVTLKKDVRRFVEDGVIFEDDDDEYTKLDTVILATGYEWKFPFLEEGILVRDGERINLYKCMFPPHLKHPTLAVIGFLLPFGPGFPLGELQTRWAAYVMSGHGSLPSEQIMLEDIKKRHEENVKRYSPSDRMSIRVDFIPYMDELANQFGVKPNFWKMMFQDHTLFRACIFGPCLSYIYRLEGHNKWDGAREAILTAHQRMRAPLLGKRVTKSKRIKQKSDVFLKYAMMFLVLAFLIFRTESSVKYYLLALILPYIMSFRGFFSKYFLVLLLLPFYVTYQGFVMSYFITLLAPFCFSMLVPS